MRIGLLVPSSNSTQEPEFYTSLPEGCSLHVTRLTLENIEENSTLRIVEEIEEGARKLSHAVNARSAMFIEDNGFEVLDQKAIGIVANREVGRLDASTALDLGAQIDRPDADSIMQACGNWKTFPINEELEAGTGTPVLTTNQVSLWHVARMLGVPPVNGLGQLLVGKTPA
ncbi:MAG: hypothetical protein KI788_03405 [Mameliella sp.]|nr:hypothetical protein [Mameliella sp.]